MKKTFKVVKIIDDTSLIVNGGSKDNIEQNDYMEIHGKSETIFDPETKEKLGNLDLIKAKLKVSEVYEKMCVCESLRVSSYVSNIMTNALFNTKQDILNVEPTEISGISDKTIRIGDIAKLIKQNKKN